MFNYYVIILLAIASHLGKVRTVLLFPISKKIFKNCTKVLFPENIKSG